MVLPVPVPGLSIRDVAEGIKLIGDVVDSTRKIIEAINDGTVMSSSSSNSSPGG
jgi:hypothetical protein